MYFARMVRLFYHPRKVQMHELSTGEYRELMTKTSLEIIPQSLLENRVNFIGVKVEDLQMLILKCQLLHNLYNHVWNVSFKTGIL